MDVYAFSLKLRCDDRFTHAFTACSCVFRVEIAKRCRFQLIEKFLLKTQNVAAFKVSQGKTATQNLGQNEIYFLMENQKYKHKVLDIKISFENLKFISATY